MTPKATTRINVEASKLDTLMYLVSELVTTKSELLIALRKQDEEKSLDAAEKIEITSNEIKFKFDVIKPDEDVDNEKE